MERLPESLENIRCQLSRIADTGDEERHVPSEENPADLLSRGIRSSALQDRSLVEWFYNLLGLQWMALTTITNEIIQASIFILTTQRFP